MNNRLKRVGVILGVSLLALLGAAVVAAAVAYSAGTIHVRVREKKPGGDNLNLVLPALAVPLGMKFMPAQARQQAAAEIGPWVPAIKAAGEELSRTPDFVLVEVDTAQEYVFIRKEGRALVIDVENEEETLHLSFPLQLVASVAAELDTGTRTF